MNTPIKIHPVRINFEIPVSKELKLKRFVFMFLIEAEKIHLIDTGVAASFQQTVEFVKKQNREISEIQNIFLTHSHPDHIGAALTIQKKTGCKVYAPRKEMNWIENTTLQFQQRPVPGFNNLVAGSVKIDFPVNDYQEFRIAENLSIQSIPTPGHSAGSTSFYLKEKRALFCGDSVLLPGEIPIFENIQQYLNSLHEIKKINPDVLYSSWDEPRYANEIPKLLERSRNYILNIQKAVKKMAKNGDNLQSMEFCKSVLKALKQKEELANPLLLKSFLACLKN